MNDVNLNSPDLKLVRTSEQAPARAISSSQAEGRNASDLAGSSAAVSKVENSQVTSDLSKAEKLQARNEATREQLDDAVSQLNDFVQNVQRDLQFEVDNELGQTIVKVVDQSTKEVIRQIPDELALRLAENLQQDEPLTLFNIKV
ncbi:flagellar protein FlaG [Marinobacter sp. DSM 26671]|jgi:flagellar protein FlaG|uniref:flagellar protein FlaG n=1 Tax=Marinobacter sp. DSM 26671 TaxID=1761793 RepID=UPI0008EDF4F8|nr:flagellar protein FlaG [Marinobacter sp. DSM 26671]MTI76212.1 flagellar protein FlaG [Marinobacter sp.]SFE23056.1 flagellar protein FlaG [Marinobacter sp. DSM 26671]|tara:strand:- start:41 stop:475 length:435 start_codon:yes stop_codon:yes gene_type:complete